MTTVRLMIGAVLVLIVSACTTAGERRVDHDADSADGDSSLSQPQVGEPDIAAASPTPTPDEVQKLPSELPPDRDGDLVADTDDQCLDSAPGSAVDTKGCAIFSGVIQNLVFAPDDDALNPQARKALDVLIADLNAYPDVVIAVDGHTDNRGLASNNLDLSKRRVIAVVRYLVEQGVSAARLKPYGYGESRPMKSNATVEGRRSNRRIEVRQVGA